MTRPLKTLDPAAAGAAVPADPNRRAAVLLAWLRRGVPPLLVVVTALVAWYEVKGFDFHTLRTALRRIPWVALLGLQALALTAVFAMVLYDWWVGRRLKVNLTWGRLIRYSWVANTTNNLIGFSGLAGSGIRILLLTLPGRLHLRCDPGGAEPGPGGGSGSSMPRCW